MSVTFSITCRALLFGVADELKSTLLPVLRSLNVNPVQLSADSGPGSGACAAADVIFCSAEADVIRDLRSTAPSARIVAVSRLAETDRWLDAIEAGADDYCALPFEKLHLRWTLDRFLQPAAQAAA